MGTTVRMTASDDHAFDAYVAPASGDRQRRGGLVVVQEIFGVNSHIRGVCDDYAAQGYDVTAPHLFDRVESDVELGYDDDAIARGLALRKRLDWNGPLLDVQAAVADLRVKGEVGVVGYCWGGSVAWLAACRAIGVSAASCFYGGQIAELTDNRPQCPTQLHFGDRDDLIPLGDIDRIRAVYPSVEVHIYTAGHGFNCDQRGSHDEASANLARERTLALFADHVG